MKVLILVLSIFLFVGCVAPIKNYVTDSFTRGITVNNYDSEIDKYMSLVNGYLFVILNSTGKYQSIDNKSGSVRFDNFDILLKECYLTDISMTYSQLADKGIVFNIARIRGYYFGKDKQMIEKCKQEFKNFIDEMLKGLIQNYEALTKK